MANVNKEPSAYDAWGGGRAVIWFLIHLQVGNDFASGFPAIAFPYKSP